MDLNSLPQEVRTEKKNEEIAIQVRMNYDYMRTSG